MTLTEEALDAFVARYVKSGQVVSLGTSQHSLTLLKKIGLRMAEEHLSDIQIVPTSQEIAHLASEFNIPLTTLNESEIDVAFEFAQAADQYFNYLKNDTTSLIRDKMVAQSAHELIVMAESSHMQERLGGPVTFEISMFGYQRTVMQLQAFGDARIRSTGTQLFKTEAGHVLADVQMDPIFDYDEIDIQAKRIPGVIETGLFIGYADRLVLHNGGIEVKSRISPSEEIAVPE